MDEKPDQIMSHIESQRDQLGRNLNELETRVKGATDWRMQFDKNPMMMMGVALGGGLLLGSMVGGGKKRNRSSWSSSRNYSGPTNMGSSSYGSSSYGSSASNLSSAGMGAAAAGSSSSSSPAVREQRKKATDTLEHMKAALIGFATAKVKEFMSEALPGFNQHMDEAEQRNTQSHHSHDAGSSSHQQSSGGYGSGSQSGSSGSGIGSSGSQGQGNQGGTAAGSQQATTRTEHSANSPYAGQTTGLNI